MLIVVTGLRGIPNVMGGVETHCEELLPRLVALDPSLQIFVAGRRPYLPDVPADGTLYHGVRVLALPSTRGTSTEAITGTLSGLWLAWRQRADLVHIHAIGPALLAPVARLLGLRVVVTHHGTDYDRAKWGLVARLVLRAGEQAALRCAHRVIAVSPSLAERLKARFPAAAARVYYVPNGAPRLDGDGPDAASVLAQFGLEAGQYILTVGRLVPEKGADYLIRAYRASACGAKLVIVGGADHASAYARDLQLQGDQQVRFLGLQSRAVLRRLYEQAGLFVLPSLHEGLPISALEAARCGAPMLLSDIPANRDVGLAQQHYFPVGDEAALAQALAVPLDRYRLDGEDISSRFDWDSIAHTTLSIYRQAANG